MSTGPSIKRGQSSGDIWTPWAFIRAVEKKFGKLSWDVAASIESAKAPKFLTKEQNSFSVEWHKLSGLSWLNCEFGKIAPWASKCAWEMTQGWRGLLLVPGSIGANWYWDAVEPYSNVYSVGRMVFDNCFDRDGKLVTTPYPKDLILCHYDQRVPRQKMRRWLWKLECALTKEDEDLAVGAIPLQAL